MCDMICFTSTTSFRSWGGLELFCERIPPLSKKKWPLDKIKYPPTPPSSVPRSLIFLSNYQRFLSRYKEEVMTKVYQDDEFIYPALDMSDDEDFKPAKSKQMVRFFLKKCKGDMDDNMNKVVNN